MAAPAPVLGLPGDLIRPGDAIDEYVSKVGGAPVWPGSSVPGAEAGPPASVAPGACASCGAAMHLVLQAHAPLDHSDTVSTRDRFLFVFACAEDGCHGGAGAWTALRAQRCPNAATLATRNGSHAHSDAPGEAAAAAAPPASTSGTGGAQQAASTAAADWGLGDDDDDDDSIEEMSHAFRNMLSEAGKRKHEQEPKQARQKRPGAMVTQGDRALGEFYILAEDEPAERALTAEERKRLERRAEEAEGRDAAAEAAPAATDAARKATGGAAPGGAGASWQGEQYEKDAAVGASHEWLKMQRRLARRPEQVARYARGLQVLWPSDETRHPGHCAACSAPRTFELQIVSPLIVALSDAADWHVSEGRPSSLVVRPPGSWDWACVVVATCSAGFCAGTESRGGWAWSREEVLVLKE
ncbi:unnamed protein product [Pedinophyceae sp. YPF-701]|nr:unnamed protein product [Pedinophyceae sp. YPF-701]